MFFDLAGALTSLLSTYYFIRMNNKAWLVGMLATCINGWLYWYKGIYADMILEVHYFLTMCYGWYKWERRTASGKIELSITHLKVHQWFILGVVLTAVFTLIYYPLQTMTNSTVAVLDASTTSLSMIAQWLMCHKITATWVLWLIADSLYVLMYLQKGLPFHSIQMLIYTSMAITGYILWTRQLKREGQLITVENRTQGSHKRRDLLPG